MCAQDKGLGVLTIRGADAPRESNPKAMRTDVNTAIAELRELKQRLNKGCGFRQETALVQIEEHIAESDAKIQRQSTDHARESSEFAAYAQTLGRLLSAPDLHFKSSDGVIVPACKDVVIAASAVIERMLASTYSEAASSMVPVDDMPAEALRRTVIAMHCPAAVAAVPFSVLFQVLTLAARWELADIVDATIAEMPEVGGTTDEWCACLKQADFQLQILESLSGGTVVRRRKSWRRLYAVAANAVAAQLPDAASASGFSSLELPLVCAVIDHIPGPHDAAHVVLLPELTVDWEAIKDSYTYGEPSASLSWLGREGGHPTHTACLAVVRRSDDRDDVWVYGHLQTEGGGQCVPRSMAIDMFDVSTDGVTFGEHTPDWEWRLPAELGVESRQRCMIHAGRINCELEDGKITFDGRVRIARQQRQYEALQLWLMSSGRSEEPLTPERALLCVRACACGVDVDSIGPAELREKLLLAGLSTDGSKREQQTRLKDELYAQPTCGPRGPVAAVCRALAELVGRGFERAAIDGGLMELDAASFSDVLSYEGLNAPNESTVLEQAVRWASRKGREVDVIDRVMPLVRFPLVPTLLPPSTPLKALEKRSEVVKELIEEAIGLQLEPTRASEHKFATKRHALLDGAQSDGAATCERHKRRRKCGGDEVPTLDAAILMSRLY